MPALESRGQELKIIFSCLPFHIKANLGSRNPVSNMHTPMHKAQKTVLQRQKGGNERTFYSLLISSLAHLGPHPLTQTHNCTAVLNAEQQRETTFVQCPGSECMKLEANYNLCPFKFPFANSKVNH